MSEANRDGTVVVLDGVTSIAIIDDDFVALSDRELPVQEHEAVISFLTELRNAEVLEDFVQCGVDEQMLRQEPYSAIDALTTPGRSLGAAYHRLSQVSGTLSEWIDARLTTRRIAEAMRNASGCEVVEFKPRDDLNVRDKELVFIDYYLEKDKRDGELAIDLAKQIQEERDPARAQQIVLMSSVGNVRSFRKDFRRSTEIQGSAFSFVAKDDLDQPWKVRAHLQMFARALPHSQVIGEYIASVKRSVRTAQIRLIDVLDDLDLGDFAYIQKLSLQDDGHPLGDYLSWLFSAHLAARAFEYELREQQSMVDRVEFDEVFISPVEPSTVVATLYHDALFARNLGLLGPHPRAAEGGVLQDIPMVGLGDVFMDSGRTRAVVILSADCDLAFAPNAERQPDRTMPVLLVEGVPRLIEDVEAGTGDATTEGLGAGSDIYRIDWNFKSYRTVPLGRLKGFLGERGVDLSGRDRLRPLYALKLQQEFGAQLLRAGGPVMPPFRKGVDGNLVRSIVESEIVDDLEDVHLSLAFVGKTRTIRITPGIAGRLQVALAELCGVLEEELSALRDGDRGDGDSGREETLLQYKVDAMRRALRDEEKWIGLLGDAELPNLDEKRKLMQGLYLAMGCGWSAPSEPAIVFRVTEMG